MEDSAFLRRVRLAGNPLAHPDSVVVRGGARFTILTARLLRLEWSPTGEFTDFSTFAFPNRRAHRPPPFTVREVGEYLYIETGPLTLTYRLRSGAFTAENLAITIRMGDAVRTWRPGQQDVGNLGGTRRTLDDTGGDSPLEPGLISRAGWALFDDSRGVVLSPGHGWVVARPEQSAQDWYFFGYGHAYADALAEYTQFGGAVPLIPRYALGIWWSRYWPYSDDDLRQLVDEFAAHRLPLDVLVVDMDWHTPGHWTGYSWNHELFPDPAAFLADMHRRGLRVALNLHPADGVHPHEAAYGDFRAALGLGDTEQGPIPFQITDPRFAEHYFRLLHHPLEDQGVDFWWLDWQQGESSDVAGLDPLIWLNHLHFADARRRGQRPLLFSRWGGLGNHRYPLGFSGDTFGGWATLAAMPRFTATAANVGFGWWSHDIGGHFGAVEPELFVRWVQFGALSPCLRLHATKDPLGERRPWAFTPQVLEATRQAFELRYRLIPYLYTMARHAHDRGSALCRPMYYAYPECEAAYDARGQYMLGDDLIAAPITQPTDARTGLAVVDVWIPPGEWYRFDTGEAFAGPRWVRIEGDLETVPLLARAGAVVPIAQPAPHLIEMPGDRLELRIFPGGDRTFRLYEDDGVSEASAQGACEWTSISGAMRGRDEHLVSIAPVEGYCPMLPAHRAYTLTFVGVEPPERVTDGAGNLRDWSYDSAMRSLRCDVPALPKDEAVEVAVRWPIAERRDAPTPGASTRPFAHVIANTARDEAQRQLGRLILVPPYGPDGKPQASEAEVVWQHVNHAGMTEISQRMPAFSAATTLEVPFVLDPTSQAQHWEVATRFVAGGERVTENYSAPYLHPPIQRWDVRYAGRAGWIKVRADLASSPNVADPFSAVLHADVASRAEAAADIVLTEPTTIAFDTWTSGTLSLEVDGQTLGGGEPRATLAGLARHWPVKRKGPLTLGAGIHRIKVQLAAPESGQWVFGVLLVGMDGLPLLQCKQLVEAET